MLFAHLSFHFQLSHLFGIEIAIGIGIESLRAVFFDFDPDSDTDALVQKTL
jgi:hypothetical protein